MAETLTFESGPMGHWLARIAGDDFVLMAYPGSAVLAGLNIAGGALSRCDWDGGCVPNSRREFREYATRFFDTNLDNYGMTIETELSK